MRTLLTAGVVLLLAIPVGATAQQWTLQSTGTSARLPTSYEGLPNSAVSCIDGHLYFETGSGLAVDAFTSAGDAASISVDGTLFKTKAEQLEHTAAVAIPPEAVPALKRGTKMAISYPTGAGVEQRSFSLRGSGRALSTIESRCGLSSASAAAPSPSPASPSASGGSDALKRLQIAVAQEVTPDCQSLGGKSVSFERGAVQTVAAADPAHPDVIFNFHHVICNGAGHPIVGAGYCGAGPCLQRRSSYANGRYAETNQYYE